MEGFQNFPMEGFQDFPIGRIDTQHFPELCSKGFCGAFPVRKPFERLDFANVAWTPWRTTTAQLSETKGGPVRLRCTALMHRS